MFVDDGSPFRGARMHGRRLPGSDVSRAVNLDGPKVIHLQYIDWARMRSKQRWYQAQERIEYPQKRPIQIYRQYHHMDAIAQSERHVLHEAWLASYEAAGLDLFSVEPQDVYPPDARVLDLLRVHGVEPFRRVDIWDDEWAQRARELAESVPAALIADPRSHVERLVFRWLARTQGRSHQRRIRWLQRALRIAGW
jgi:hypothetical protein